MQLAVSESRSLRAPPDKELVTVLCCCDCSDAGVSAARADDDCSELVSHKSTLQTHADCSLRSRQARLRKRYYANLSAWDVNVKISEADSCIVASVLHAIPRRAALGLIRAKQLENTSIAPSSAKTRLRLLYRACCCTNFAMKMRALAAWLHEADSRRRRAHALPRQHDDPLPPSRRSAQ